MITSFLIYQLKVAVILASFYLLYELLMRRETLHRLNRCLLLGSIVLSMVIPFCKITIHKQATAEIPAMQYQQPIPMPADMNTASVPAIEIPQSEAFTTPIYAETPVQIIETVDAQEPETAVTVNEIKATRTIGWQQIVFLAWALGVLFFLIRLAASIISISNIIRRGRVACVRDGVKIVVTRIDTNPFSWMNSIVITQQDYDSGSADAIIEHELSHVRNHHSWDLLLTDLFGAMQWFNPAVYDLRSSLQEVHEYQADNSVIRHGFNVRNYQMMLIGKLALENGFSIANNFSKKNLSNRISMMNKKNSPFARAWKALFVPVLTGLFLAFTAVTVYDCAPSKSIGMDDEFKKLQEHYGQGAFVAANYTPCNIVMEADHKNATVTIGSSRKSETVSLESLPSYLEKQEDHEKLRPNICVQNWGINKNDNTEVLKTLKPLLTKLEAIKIRSLVVPTQYMMNEYYYSTYKYARIYESDNKGNYIFVHNELTVLGDAKTMAEWIGLLNIQYVAFYTVGIMPISDAALIMDAAKARGIMTFITCRATDGTQPEPSYMRSSSGFMSTILPVNRNLESEFKGMALIDVARELEREYTEVYYEKARKVVTRPARISCDQWFVGMKLLFCDDEFIMILNPLTMSRNSWCRPDDVVIRVDGKEYKKTKQEGFQNFSDYPWVTADGYANGSLCWGPELSSILTTIHFEPIPFDSKVMDILQNEDKQYAARGVILQRPTAEEEALARANNEMPPLDNYSAIGNISLKNVPGTGSVYVSSIEFLKDRTNLIINLRMQAPFDYPGFIGSDVTLTLKKNGKEYKIQGAEGAVLDKDFDRGGDHVTTTVILTFPVMDPNDVISDMTQDDINRREPTPNGAEDMKNMTLEGTICHQKVRIPITVPKIVL